jgi:hypothetical protein
MKDPDLPLAVLCVIGLLWAGAMIWLDLRRPR